MQAVQQSVTDNIFDRKFHALELYQWFKENFPDAFPMEIYQGGTLNNFFEAGELIWACNIQTHARGDFNQVKFPAEYCVATHGAEFYHYRGEECCFIRLVVYDQEGKYYFVSWGYYLGDITRNYALELFTPLLNKKQVVIISPNKNQVQ